MLGPRGHGAASRVHVAHAREIAVEFPRLRIQRRAGITELHVWRPVIEPPLALTPCAQAPADSASLLQHGHGVAVVRERARTGEPRHAGAHDDHAGGCIARRALHPPTIRREIEALEMFARGPRAHGAKHAHRWGEGAVELPETPEQATVRRRITPVERVAMVEIHQPLECLLGALRPDGNRLSPRHAHVVVQLAVAQQRLLGDVPQGIAGLRACESLPRQHVARITFVCGQRVARPRGDPLDGRRRCMPIAERVAQFAPHEQFVEVLLRPVAGQSGAFPRDAQRRHHAVVEVRRHAAHAVDRGIVALRRVFRETAAARELLPARVARARPTRRVRHRPHTMIDLAFGHQ